MKGRPRVGWKFTGIHRSCCLLWNFFSLSLSKTSALLLSLSNGFSQAHPNYPRETPLLKVNWLGILSKSAKDFQAAARLVLDCINGDCSLTIRNQSQRLKLQFRASQPVKPLLNLLLPWESANMPAFSEGHQSLYWGASGWALMLERESWWSPGTALHAGRKTGALSFQGLSNKLNSVPQWMMRNLG